MEKEQADAVGSCSKEGVACVKPEEEQTKQESGEGAKAKPVDLKAELASIQASILQLDEKIVRMKEARGWFVKPPTSKRKLQNNVHATLWRSLLTAGEFMGTPHSIGMVAQQNKKGAGRNRLSGSGRSAKRGRESVATHSQEWWTGGRLGKRAWHPNAKERRMESFWGQCGTILNALKKHRYSWPFLAPVDTVALNIPDYLNVVKCPMDLGTITKRLEASAGKGPDRSYKSPLEFRDDVRQVWANCRAYNRPGQDVRIMGDFLSEMWERKWCQSEIEEKWELELTGEIQAPSQSKSLLGAPCSKTKKVHIEQDREMSFTEKRRLAQLIGSLNGDQLSGIVDILLIDQPTPQKDDDLELDLDKTNPQTLWKMKQYVDGLNSRRKGRHPAKRQMPGSHSHTENGGDRQSSQMMGTQSLADTDDYEDEDGISEISNGMQIAS